MTMCAASIEIESYATLLPIIEKTEKGKVLLGQMTYTYEGLTTLRHPMETGEACDKTIMDTVRTCALHEIADDAAKFAFKTLAIRPILTDLIPSDRQPDKWHLKTVFPVQVVRGKLRKRSMPDEDAILGPINMIEASELLRRGAEKLFPMLPNDNRRISPYFHTRATLATLSFLGYDRDVLHRYSQNIIDWEDPDKKRRLSDEEKSAVDEYLSQHLGA